MRTQRSQHNTAAPTNTHDDDDDDDVIIIDRVGSIVGEKWRLEWTLWVGRVTSIYAATNIHNGYPAAVKVMNATVTNAESSASATERIERELREAYVANSVFHPGTVRVLGDGFTHDGCAYLVMERLLGETLETRCARLRARQGHVSPQQAAGFACGVLAILVDAHLRNIAHRNITLTNVFITTEGRVRLLGFGSSRRTRERMVMKTATKTATKTTASSSNTTTLPAPPTLPSGGVVAPAMPSGVEEVATVPFLSGPAIDIYAVGALLAALLGPSVPPALARVIDRACRRSNHTFPDAESMIAALDEAVTPTSGRSDTTRLSAPSTLVESVGSVGSEIQLPMTPTRLKEQPDTLTRIWVQPQRRGDAIDQRVNASAGRYSARRVPM